MEYDPNSRLWLCNSYQLIEVFQREFRFFLSNIFLFVASSSLGVLYFFLVTYLNNIKSLSYEWKAEIYFLVTSTLFSLSFIVLFKALGEPRNILGSFVTLFLFSLSIIPIGLQANINYRYITQISVLCSFYIMTYGVVWYLTRRARGKGLLLSTRFVQGNFCAIVVLIVVVNIIIYPSLSKLIDGVYQKFLMFFIYPIITQVIGRQIFADYFAYSMILFGGGNTVESRFVINYWKIFSIISFKSPQIYEIFQYKNDLPFIVSSLSLFVQEIIFFSLTYFFLPNAQKKLSFSIVSSNTGAKQISKIAAPIFLTFLKSKSNSRMGSQSEASASEESADRESVQELEKNLRKLTFVNIWKKWLRHRLRANMLYECILAERFAFPMIYFSFASLLVTQRILERDEYVYILWRLLFSIALNIVQVCMKLLIANSLKSNPIYVSMYSSSFVINLRAMTCFLGSLSMLFGVILVDYFDSA